MKKLLVFIGCLCTLSFAYAADNLDEVYTWSYNGLADTLFDMSAGCESENTNILLQLNDYINENDANLSVKQIVNKCVDLSNQETSTPTCKSADESKIYNWTEMAGVKPNEFCDVFVSELVQNHNNAVNSQGIDDFDELDETEGYGCPKRVIDSKVMCQNMFERNAVQLARCYHCVENAGGYEYDAVDKKYKCYAEILGWYCTGHDSWNDTKYKNPAPCKDSNKRYSGCRYVRKYVDVEKSFTCDVGKYVKEDNIVLSGCAQHACGETDKHPPLYIFGNQDQDCKLPLYQNKEWRTVKSRGTRASMIYKGVKHSSTDWCMPAANVGPWNSDNHTGNSKHLCSIHPKMSGGETIPYWFKL